SDAPGGHSPCQLRHASMPRAVRGGEAVDHQRGDIVGERIRRITQPALATDDGASDRVEGLAVFQQVPNRAGAHLMYYTSNVTALLSVRGGNVCRCRRSPGTRSATSTR